MLSDIVELCRDWPSMDRSIGKFAIAAVVMPLLMAGILNLPWIMLIVCIWAFTRWSSSFLFATLGKLVGSIPFVSSVRPSARLLSEPVGRMPGLKNVSTLISAKPIPGTLGLPLIGETISFIVASRQFLLNKYRQYGNIFATAIDFSGTFLVARRVVCLVQTPDVIVTTTNSATPPSDLLDLDLPTINNHTSHTNYPLCRIYTHPNLKYVAYSGLFGSSSPVKLYIPDLANRILNNYSSLDRWEDLATPIIRTFLRRLVYEGNFSFADRVKELACELVSTIFLNMTGLSVPLLTALDEYLSASRHNSSFNASLKHRKQISHFMHVAVFEEDRRFYARSWDSYDNIHTFRTTGPAYGAQQQQYGTYHDDISPEEMQASENCTVLNDLLDMCTLTLQQGRTQSATSDTMQSATTTSTNRVHPTKHTSAHKSHTHGAATPATPHATYTSASRADTDQHDLFFILLVEVIYSTLVAQLRTLVQQIVTNHQHLPANCRSNYTEYLAARQLVGNVSGTGLSRLSWGSTIYEEEDGIDNMDLQSADSSESEELKSEDVVSTTKYTTVDHSDRSTTSAVDQSRPNTSSSSVFTSSSGIGNFLLSQVSWPLSPAPTPAAREGQSQTSHDNSYIDSEVQGSTSGIAGRKTEDTIYGQGYKQDSSSSSGSGRADYTFPISSSSSSHNGSSSSTTGSDLRYSTSSSNHDLSHNYDRVGPAGVVSSSSSSIILPIHTDAGVKSLNALQTPPVDQYGRRMHTLGSTLPHTTRTAKTNHSSSSNTLDISTPAPSTPVSRSSRPISIGSSSTTSNISTTSIISSASKYTGRYGPRRTPGRSVYNVVTPARGAATPSATRSAAKSAKDSVSEAESPRVSSNTLAAPIFSSVLPTSISSVSKKSAITRSSSARRRKKASKNSVRHRQKLIIKYITSVKRVVDEARLGTVLAPLPLQYSLHLCTQAFDVVLKEHLHGNLPELAAYTINRDDLVINIHPNPLTATDRIATTTLSDDTRAANTAIHSPDSFYTAHSNPTHSTSSTNTDSTNSSSPTAHTDLGIFSELILSIFTHELTTGYLWEVPQTSQFPTPTSSGDTSQHIAAVNSNSAAMKHSESRGGAIRTRSNSLHMHTTHSHHTHTPTGQLALFDKAQSLLSPYISQLHNLLSNYVPAYSAGISNIRTLTTPTNSIITTMEDGFCTVPNHSVQVRKFRTSPENFAFLIGADSVLHDNSQSGNVGYDESEEMYGIGSVEEDVRYYSDGL